ncbi:MAG: beta-3-deoxy-D-manno-oct-2-ulosonic acid transferase [Pseudomonadota bacterium]|nr:beta-3-deoxy-D-manno-oct-2-ulosonic acid transferase [Pseudomonadota bacterium]
MPDHFLRTPPFPGHRAGPLVVQSSGRCSDDVDALIAALAGARVGGAFWAAQAELPAGRDVLLAPDTQAQAWAMLDTAMAQGDAARAVLIGPFSSRRGQGAAIPVIARQCDPWHLAEQASEVRAGADSELALVAALLGRPVTVTGEGRYAPLDDSADSLRAVVAAQLLDDLAWHDPFTGSQVAASDIVALLAEWRALIDANRGIAAVFGVAPWKRVTMDALLWDGSGRVRHGGKRQAAMLVTGQRTLAWKTRTPPQLLEGLAARGIPVGEIEDGMIRSTGLGANCVPPLSVIIDPLAAHFDPSQPSTLEHILQYGDIAPEQIARARRLRARLVAAGISKYGQDAAQIPPAPRAPGQRRRVLVTGQVEDDRAVLLGGAGCTNRALLARARAEEPDANIIYKPHPDVEAGHRLGTIPDAEVLAHADRIERHTAISTLLGQVDALHVINSLAGFEALCRNVEVITHGVPFYAGWGLTRDLGPVPDRRQRRRCLDELIAAVLILYPRYLDPVTRLPCPVEVLVERMAAGNATVSSPLVKLREWQGQANVWIGKMTAPLTRP